MRNPDRPVVLAVITGAHGLAGEVRLKLFGEGVDELKGYKRFNMGALTLKSIKPVKGGAIGRFAEIPDRSAAERARGTELTVPRSALPPLGEGEYYHHDLLGLPCVSTTGEALGHIVLIDNFGAGDILEIERPADEEGKPGKRFMVPMTATIGEGWHEGLLVIDDGFVDR